MSEKTYTLLSWKGEEQGQFSASDIRRMWESEEISGLYQVVDDSGNMTVQDFMSYEEEQSDKESLQQQQLIEAQAEADRQRLERERIEAETVQRLELERMKGEQERAEQERLDEEMSGKIYYLYLGGQKKGPYSKENLQIMRQGGKIDDSTQVWTQDLGEWVELRGFKEIMGSSETPGLPTPQPGRPPPQYPGRHPGQYPSQHGPHPRQDPPRRRMNVSQGGMGQAPSVPRKPETPGALIAWVWILMFLPGILFQVMIQSRNEAAVIIGGLIAIGGGLACLIISIVLTCSPSTAGRVNGIIVLALIILGTIAQLAA